MSPKRCGRCKFPANNSRKCWSRFLPWDNAASPILLDRVREVTRLEQQSEKLNALGKLAANLAHELNNPASAAQRASSNLMEELRAYGKVSFEAGRLCLTNEQEERYMEWNRNIRCAIEGRTKAQNPMEAGALEERLTAGWSRANLPSPGPSPLFLPRPASSPRNWKSWIRFSISKRPTSR